VTDEHRYLVLGRDLDPATPWIVGDVVDVYPVLEIIDEFVSDAREARAALDGHVVLENRKFFAPGVAEAFARGAAAVLAAMEPRPRVQWQRTCNCSKKGRNTPLVIAYAMGEGGIWVWVRGYRIPEAARRERADLHEADTFWPLNSLPYVRPTRCPHCRKYFGVLLKPSGYQLVRFGKPHFDAKVPI
jgi:hypothetical protein